MKVYKKSVAYGAAIGIRVSETEHKGQQRECAERAVDCDIVMRSQQENDDSSNAHLKQTSLGGKQQEVFWRMLCSSSEHLHSVEPEEEVYLIHFCFDDGLPRITAEAATAKGAKRGLLLPGGDGDTEFTSTRLAWERLRGRPGEGAVLVFYVPLDDRGRGSEVLDRFVGTKLMSTEEADSTYASFAVPESVGAVAQQSTSRTYISEMVRDYLLNKSTVLGATYAERYNALYRGGLRIQTTIDASAQAKAEKASRDKLPANKTGIQTDRKSVV